MTNNYTSKDHTFVVCAYKESEYLPLCIQSLLNQDVKGNIIISTSTPNEYISDTAKQYDIELRVNSVSKGIANDWNFAYKQAATKLITLAHQDDIYMPNYLSTALKEINRAKDPIIFFSDYAEIINNEIMFGNLRLNIKKYILKPMKLFQQSKFIRRRLLSLGNMICCPSVMYINIDSLEFSDEFKFCLDWQKWEELSRLKGSFVYSAKPLLYHRLHKTAETSIAIQSGTRRMEDYQMFKMFWWKPLAWILTRLYTKNKKNSGA